MGSSITSKPEPVAVPTFQQAGGGMLLLPLWLHKQTWWKTTTLPRSIPWVQEFISIDFHQLLPTGEMSPLPSPLPSSLQSHHCLPSSPWDIRTQQSPVNPWIKGFAGNHKASGKHRESKHLRAAQRMGQTAGISLRRRISRAKGKRDGEETAKCSAEE